MSDLRLVLFQPDIPQNAGAILRLAACLGVTVDLVEPAGFIIDDARLRRAGLDYVAKAALVRHASWDAFLTARPPGRLLLATTRGDTPHHRFAFRADDQIVLGRESAGAPPEVHAAAEARLVIAMRPGLRSINVAQAAAMLVGEALRQTDGYP